MVSDDPCHRQDPGALRAGPGFAEAGLERRGHDPHHLVEIIDPARPQPDRIDVARGASPSGRPFGRASGARA